MKTSPFDFILCGIVITLILGSSLFLMYFGIAPFTKSYLKEYHVIVDFFLFLLSYGLLSGFVIQLLIIIKPLQLGEFSMDHPQFTYWKLLSITYRLGEFFLFPFTTVFTKPLIIKLFGAKIGKNVAIGGCIEDPYLITIGDNSIIGHNSLVCGNASMNGKITFGKVIIGDNVTIGINSVVLPDSEIGDGSILSIGSVILFGTKVPSGEIWRGNPARKWQAIASSTKEQSILGEQNELRNYKISC